MQIILKYFPGLTISQKIRFEKLEILLREWNQKINLISRKDIPFLFERHILHSLAIAKQVQFPAGESVLDVGTGGGFPGIPLAVLFPETKFHLVDSIGKKIMVVSMLGKELGLDNLSTEHARVENIQGKFEFIVSRAVTTLPEFVRLVKGKCRLCSQSRPDKGLYYLKGGELSSELKSFPDASIFPVSEFFNEPFFDTKLIVHIPAKYLWDSKIPV